MRTSGPASLFVISLWIFLCSLSYLKTGQASVDSDDLSTDSLLVLAERMWQSDIDSTISLAEIALQMARDASDRSLIAHCHLRLGEYHQYKGAVVPSYQHLNEASELYRALGDRDREASALHNIGLLYLTSGSPVKAREYYLKALHIEEEIDDYESMSNTLIKLSDAHRAQGDYDGAKSVLKRALDICVLENDLLCRSIASSNLAALYNATDSLDLALEWYEKALKYTKEAGSPHAEAILLLELSRIYKNKSAFQKAEDRIRSAIELARTTHSDLLVGSGYESLAGLYDSKKDWARSAHYYDRAKQLYNTSNFNTKYLSTGIYLCRILLKMNKLDSVFRLAKGLAFHANRSQNWQKEEESLSLALRAAREMEDSSKITALQARLLIVKDSLYLMEQEERIGSLESQYALFEKERELQLLRENEWRQQLWRNSLIGGILFLIIIGGLLINRQRLRIHNKEAELKLSQLEQKELERDLTHKNKRLTTHALHMAQKNQLLKEIKIGLKELRQDLPSSGKDRWRKLIHHIDYSFSLDDDWREFKMYFEEVHQGFFDALEETAEDLSPNDYRIAALARLNLSIKQMASLLNISPDSVKVARYRLRKKLPLDTDEHLGEFLNQLEKTYRQKH